MLPAEIFVIFVTFLGGLIVGSFLNAAEFRLARQMPLAWRDGAFSRSICPHCTMQLALTDLIPVLSFLALRGKCRYCEQSISWQYPLVELATALAFGLVAYRFGLSWQMPLILLITATLIFIFLYDLKQQIILDRVVIPAVLLLAPLNYLVNGLAFINQAFGAAIAGGFFALQYLLSRGKWIGAGDIRLGILMGVILGWQQTLLALMLAYTFGAIFALGLLLLKKATLKTQLPLGTFLTAATFVCLLYGSQISQWYFNIFDLFLV